MCIYIYLPCLADLDPTIKTLPDTLQGRRSKRKTWIDLGLLLALEAVLAV